MAIDSKYGSIDIPGIPENEPVFILRGQDKATPTTIHDYSVNARHFGSSSEHCQHAKGAANQIASWQDANPDNVKIAD